MKAFADLYDRLDATTGTNAKVAAMANYFREAPQDDAAWALYFLTGRRLRRLVSSISLRTWTLELTGLSEWLFQESYSSVGDTAECCALLLDALPHERKAPVELSLTQWMEERIQPLMGKSEPEQREKVVEWWSQLEGRELFMLNKLLTGAFRVGVSQGLVAKGLAEVSGLSNAEIAHRLMGDWQPTAEWFASILNPGQVTRAISRPYPFFLASPLEQEATALGAATKWQAEWKWDGIRSQLIKRDGEIFLWSRGEELITERFPEIQQAALTLPDGTVIDAEVLAAHDGEVLPFAELQKRIGRKKLTKTILAEAPAILMAYDLLEENHEDLRDRPMAERRARLEKILGSASRVFRLSPLIEFNSWDDLAEQRTRSRELGVEGVMLKRKSSLYQAGRRRGDWWKWKIDPLTIDAVLIYAQAGTGRRASLFTDYTFAVWKGDELVPIAKAYSGLTDEEIGSLDNWIRRHTRERFGPVRSVEPFHVFELAFEGINASPRHRSGIAMRFPRILRWRHDKKIHDADKIETLQAMIDGNNRRVSRQSQAPQQTERV